MSTAKITDVAKAAGVSPATVSYVLSGKRPISQETKDRVFRVIRELNYSPNPNARALKSSRTNTIGVLASDFAEISVSRIILSIEKVTCRLDYHLFFASGYEFDYDVRAALRFLLRRRLDGVIILFGITSDDPVGEIEGVDLPVVSINRPIQTKYPSVLPDNHDGGRQAARHLVESGSQYPALISGPSSRYSSRERARGFKEELKHLGIHLPKERVYTGDYNYESGIAGVSTLLARNDEIDGLFCANDQMAAGAINKATSAGIDIPEKLKVVGFDNTRVAAIWPIPISTFTSPLEEMGKQSADILLAMIDGRSYEGGTTLVKSTPVPRLSSLKR